MNDVHVDTLSLYFSFLEPEPPLTKELDKWGIKQYPSQKIHMVEWLQEQLVTHGGAYGRTKNNDSSKTMYNRFQNPGGLLWIAEVLGEKEENLRKAFSAAEEAQRTAAKYDGKSRCAAFRSVIPWERICELLQAPENWLYDPQMKDVIEFDKSGFPSIKKGKKTKYETIYCTEAGL